MLVAASMAFAACTTRDADNRTTDSAAGTTAAPNVVTFKADDYDFEIPDTVPAGLTTIRLEAGGKELHHAAVLKLNEGKTPQDLLAALREKPAFPSWAVEVGGPNPPAPGAVAEATMNLEPGQYMVVCMVPSPDGAPHIAKGMYKPFVVTGSATNVQQQADVEMKLVDYGFELSEPLTVGSHVVRVVNTGPQSHEVAVVKLAPGKKAVDVAKWIEKPQGPPPGQPLGGVAGLAPGASATFPITLEKGEYALLCFLPDAKDGKPHLVHGMMTEVTVQ